MINADEIAGIIKQRIATFKTGAERIRSRHRHRGRRQHRAHLRSRSRAGVGARAVSRTASRASSSTSKRTTSASRSWVPTPTSRKAIRFAAPAASSRSRSAKRCSAASSTRSARRSTARGRSKRRSGARSRTRAPGVVERQGVKQPLQTGIRAIDALIPIGKGQRELIIGDRGTGKTAIAVDTIINQKGKNVFCIYVAIGQKNSTVAALAQTLEQNGAMEYTTIVTVSPAEPAALKWIAPFAGCAMGEELMYAGKDVLIIYDNLTQHAQAYREVSLLAAPPAGPRSLSGRHLLPALAPVGTRGETLRRARRRFAHGAAGHRDAGRRRVGVHPDQPDLDHRRADLPADARCSSRASGRRSTSVSRCRASAVRRRSKRCARSPVRSSSTSRSSASSRRSRSSRATSTRTPKQQLTRGEKITEVLKQPQFHPQLVEEQVAVIFAATRGYLDEIPTNKHRRVGESRSCARCARSTRRSSSRSDRPRSSATTTRRRSIAAIEEFNKSF